MFGYIKPFPPELKVKEYELYKSVYCGLCKNMGSHTSCLSRLTLSYDFVFLAMIRMVLQADPITITPKRCGVHPFKKRPAIDQNAALIYCSKVSALLVYHNLKDDIADSKGWKKLSNLLLLPAAKHIRKKAYQYETLDGTLKEKLVQLQKLEKEATASIDLPASVFGELLSVVCAYGLEEKQMEFRIAKEIGYHVGRWIYIIDAMDDLKKDEKENQYNPFLLTYPTCSAADILQLHGPSIRDALRMELTRIEAAMNLLPFSTPDKKGLEAILQNILYLGMTECIDKICVEGAAKQ